VLRCCRIRRKSKIRLFYVDELILIFWLRTVNSLVYVYNIDIVCVQCCTSYYYHKVGVIWNKYNIYVSICKAFFLLTFQNEKDYVFFVNKCN
jgi:hypothetical protein